MTCPTVEIRPAARHDIGWWLREMLVFRRRSRQLRPRTRLDGRPWRARRDWPLWRLRRGVYAGRRREGAA